MISVLTACLPARAGMQQKYYGVCLVTRYLQHRAWRHW